MTTPVPFPAAVRLPALFGAWASLLLSLGLTERIVSPATAQQPAAAQKTPAAPDSIERDYSRELPRIAPKSPAEALGTFTVAPGFRIEQVAAEPLLTDPVAMAWDESGRLFVIEMRDYSEDDQAMLGLVRLLEDRDGDGRYDHSHVFVDGLSWPTAIACYDGGVFVGAAPDIWYFKDQDGDGKVEIRRKLFTGFGRGNVQGLLNTFLWGLDNRIHGATSSSGGTITSVENPDAPPVDLRGRDFAIDPRTMTIEPTSGGGQHGMSFNGWGEKFVCSNSNHIQAVLYEERYAARNPYLIALSPRVSIAADGPQADVFRTSPVEPWRIVRTRLRSQGIVPGPVEGGGKAAGYFTGATGVTIFTGDGWPAEYSGWAIVGDVGSNLVHRKRLDPQGVTYVARRVDEGSELLSSSDIWFRPVQFANGPDGALYIADMYREVIEHPASLHPVIKQHLDLTSGRDRGRIYRLVGKDFQQPAAPRLGAMRSAELVELLGHPSGWRRETAARLLYQRQDLTVVPALQKLAGDADLPEGRIQALYTLDGCGQLSEAVLLAALSDSHPRVRQHAVRLSERLAADSPALRNRLLELVADPDLHVRYQLAFSLGQLRGPRRDAALAELAVRDAAEPYVRLAVMSSLAEGSGNVLNQLATNDRFRKTAEGKTLLQALAAQIGKQQRADDVASLLTTLRQLNQAEPAAMQAIINGLALKSGSPLARQVADATGGRADELLARLLSEAMATARDDGAAVEKRVAAIGSLKLGEYPPLAPVFQALLAPAQPADVQTAALDVMASFTAPQVADLLIQRWPTFTPQVRGRAGDVLATRPVWLESLLGAVEQKKIAVADLAPGRWQLLAVHSNPDVRQRAERLAAQLQTGRRGDVVQDYQSVLSTAGDADRGKEVFKKQCAGCHQVQGIGYPLAPSLAAMKNRGDEAILLNVLDPNREVNPKFLSYVVITQDGRSLSGMIASETATSVTLKRADNAEDTVLRIDIEEMRSSGLSLMPEGLEKQIDKQAMADLLAYLKIVE
ncbi:MAG: HEAT repeat domain-containing protein [Pirellulaceae bacterium]|nr:HEAT repeat domain-containing protein [Pirellulaceae bacterium]